MARKKRAPQEINAGSMADIAFLLLIFFLVTTTMDVDTGLLRVLPPPVPENQEPPPPVKKRNVFEVLVNLYDQLLVEGEQIDISQLKEKTKEFVRGYGGSEAQPNFPEFKPTDDEEVIEYFGEGYMVSKQVVSLKNDKGTSYGMYIRVQNELAAAYNELRNELAQQRFGMSYDDLLKDDRNKDKVTAIKKIYPQRISEAEPRDIGGGQ